MTLERKTPLKRTPFNRKVPLNSRRALRPKSKKRQSLATEYAKLRERLVEHPSARCAICGGRPTDLHHRREMSMGGAYTNPANVVPLCRSDHDAVHADPAGSAAKGWLVTEGHPEFESLGARIWRIK